MAEVIRVNQDIQLKNGMNEFVIDSDRELELTFTANTDCQVFVRIRNAGSLRIRSFTAAETKMTILFWNEMKQKLCADETYEVLADADVTVAYAECNFAKTRRKTFVALREPGAKGNITSASLVDEEKDYSMEVVNFAPHTFGDMNNFAVVLQKGRLTIDAIGKVVKGAYRSESHQTSRALSFEEGQKSTILPELLIDENDVQASHAMSIGRMDDDQLYYLMSRGLSVQQCIGLISTGYLMPITEVISDDSLKNILKKEMERKLSELC